MNIKYISSQDGQAAEFMTQLRKTLSPRGDVVSEAGRQRTIEIFGEALTPQQVVEKICRDVDARGLDAVLEYSERIDGKRMTPEELRVPQEELDKARDSVEPEFLDAVRKIRQNIVEFQTAILHKDVRVERPNGYLMERYLPLNRVGVCVPGGAAAYPSSVLMTAIPAQCAGVKEIAVVAPPTPNGSYNRDMLAVCCELGIKEVYRVGGAQAVAALAYGVEGLPKVDKIVGPGNLFVALAKRFVFGDVAIDSIAGPSEVVVIVDDSTNPKYIAADLIAQAEHAPGASILISWRKPTLDAVIGELDVMLGQLSRGDLARQCLEDFGALILAQDPDDACQISDAIAPEHLHVAIDNAEELLPKLHNAGAIFLGTYTPVALGDYCAGPSHVLPTSGTARFASGLSANDFVRPGSVIHFNRDGMRQLAPLVESLATKEGLTGHRESVRVRM